MLVRYSDPGLTWKRVTKNQLLQSRSSLEMKELADKYDPGARSAGDLHDSLQGDRGIAGMGILAGVVCTAGSAVSYMFSGHPLSMAMGLAGVGILSYSAWKANSLMAKETAVRTTAEGLFQEHKRHWEANNFSLHDCFEFYLYDGKPAPKPLATSRAYALPAGWSESDLY